VIGTVLAKGTFQLDSATVKGNATLFEGATVETRAVGSTVELGSGVRFLLASDSRGKIFGDHLILEKGQSQLEKGAAYRLEARGLSIHPETAASTARVSIAAGSRVQVAALTGSFRVRNSRGLLVASIATGTALEFDPQAAAQAASKLSGCLQKKAGRYVLTDEITNVTVELAGDGLEKEVGNRVEISGSLDPTATPSPEASQVIRVNAVRRMSKGCPSKAGAAGAAAGAATGGAGGGVAASTVAIIGGVAAAATVGGLAAAGKLPGQGSEPAKPISQ
jgi:hypothetical protein